MPFSTLRTAGAAALVLLLAFTAGAAEPTSPRRKAEAKALLEKLEKGEIPEELRELWRLVPENHPDAQHFQKEMERIAKRLYGQDFSKEPVRFLLAADDVPNAFTLRVAKPPIIAFSRGLLAQLQTEDQLAWVLGHEWTHGEFARKFGSRFRNSKTEELAADVQPVRNMYDAGYDPREAGKAARLLLDAKTNPWFKLFDVHPLDVNRIAVVDSGLAALDREVGGFTARTPTAMPETVAAARTTQGHESYLDRQLKDSGYDAMSPAEKLRFLTEVIARGTPWNDARREDVTAKLKKIKTTDPKDEKWVAARDALANLLLDKLTKWLPEHLNFPEEQLALEAYRALSMISGLKASGKGMIPMGRLRPLELAFRRFRDAENPDDADVHARRILELAPKINVSPKFLREHMGFSQFQFPEEPENLTRRQRERNVVSWNTHVEWAEGTEGQDVLAALVVMGVTDPRLIDKLSNTTADKLATGDIERLSPGPTDGGYKIDDIRMDDDGVVRRLSSRAGISRGNDTGSELLEKVTVGRIRSIVLGLMPDAAAGDVKARETIVKLAPRIRGVDGEILGLEHLTKDPELFHFVNFHLPAEKDGSLNRRILTDHLRPILQGKDKRAIAAVVRYLGLNGKMRATFLWSSSGTTALRDPLFRLIAENPGGHFSKHAVHKVMADASVGGDPKTDDFARSRLGYSRPHNGPALMALAERLGAGTNLEFSMLMRDTALLLQDHDGHLEGFDPIVFAQRATRGQNKDDIDPSRKPTARKLNENVRAYLAQQVAAAGAGLWSKDAVERGRQWQEARRFGIFPSDGVLERSLLSDLLAEAERERDLPRRIAILEAVLFGSSIRFPELRERAQRGWTESMSSVYGRDDGSADYRRRLAPHLKDLKEHTPRSDRSELLSLLGDKLLAQKQFADQLRKAYRGIDASDVQDTSSVIFGLEGVQLLTIKDANLRGKILDYLISDRNKALEEELAEALIERAEKMGEMNEQQSNALKNFRNQRIRSGVGDLFENFWSAPLAGRAIFLERMVLPDSLEDARKGFGDSYEVVAKRLFPPGTRYGREANIFLKAYFDVLPDYQKRILLAVLLGAVRRESNGTPSSIGERLAYVLEMMGPAETKLGQAIHSHPQTPEDIREGMPRLKSGAATPERWELTDLYHSQVPERERRKVKRLGRILGSASYYVVVEVEMKDGTTEVLALLRPNALERSENGFSLLEAMTGRLHLDIAPETLDVVRELLAQSRASAALETDSAVGRRQYDLGVELYRDREVQSDGIRFRFHVPRTLRAGQGYRFMEKAPGVHFNELPETTEAERAHKRALAKAYLALELSTILKGGVFDHDRHGAQMRVVGNDVYLFDWGGMALESPTEAERRQLGETFAAVAPALLDGKDFGGIVFEEIRKRRARGENVDYLSRVQKGILALNDFRRHLEPSDLVDALRAVGAVGIHPQIQEAATVALMSSGNFGNLMRLAQALGGATADPCVRIFSALPCF